MKYNWSIIGHEKQLALLERDLAAGNLAHAYLLAGPNSVGKNTVAKKLAGILQCEQDFCHECAVCRQVAHKSHIDTIFLENDHESIKIEQVRKLNELVSMTRQARYKVVVIENIERMTPEAANSFLKTLEEPPAGTIFILTSNEIHLLPKTIISRVRVLRFGLLAADYLLECLRGRYPHWEEADLKQASLFANGRSGKAIALVENPELLAEHRHVYNQIQHFLDHRNVSERFAFVEDLLVDTEKIEVFLAMMKNVLRTRMLNGNESERVLALLAGIEEAQALLKTNVNSRLLLENLLLTI